MATAAGSGKTLGMWLTPLAEIMTEPGRGTVLYLAPTKALGADQLSGLERMTGLSAVGAGPSAGAFRAATCDGDTELEVRRWVQATADAVLTNPDYLHFSLLPRHAYWTRFFRRLRWVLIDEAHAYRGLFGAHVSLVIRRLRRVAAHYGAAPTFALASATIAEPAATAGALIGCDPSTITCVAGDDAPRGRRTVVLWQPPFLEPDEPTKPSDDPDDAADQLVTQVRRSAEAEAADLVADLAGSGAQTLAFVRSRFAAESVADSARIRLGPAGAGRITSYRGGYLPEERREIEAGLRRGSLSALVSTTALELGIDIPGLDVAMIVGWPGTRASFWQQAGRAGRGGGDGLAVWVAGTNPLDAYLVEHPEAIFGPPVEATVFDPTNQHILAPHLCAAASELPIRPDDVEYFGSTMPAILQQLTDLGVLRHRTTGWYWRPTEPASSLTDLRGDHGPPVDIVEADTGRLLGTVDAGRAEATVHIGAIYLHRGAAFIVTGLDLDGHIATVSQTHLPHRTRANTRSTVAIIAEHRVEAGNGFAWHLGDVEVRSQVTSYTRMRSAGGATIDTVPLDLPEHAMRTVAAWLTVESSLLDDASLSPRELPGALHAAEHAAIGLLPLLATCDRWDLGGLSSAFHGDTEGPVIFIHDAAPGGAGFAARAFAAHGALTTAVRDLLQGCGCSDGCPSCVQSPKCGNANQMLDKGAALRLVEAVARG
jgi:DEAD/DEAH box helicase domain-containing protein